MEHIETGKLIEACEDLNKVLGLEPKIITTFETKAKGAAKSAAEKKFKAGLVTEIIGVASGKDPASGAYDLEAGDLSVLQPGTVELVYELCPEAKERLTASKPLESVAVSAVQKKKSAKKKEVNFWQHRLGSQSDAVDQVVKPLLDADVNCEISAKKVAEATKLSKGRVKSHLLHLIKKQILKSSQVIE